MSEILFLKADGTVADMELVQTIVDGAVDLNDAKAQLTDMLADKGVCWMQFGFSDQAPIEIRTEFTRQALTGATDFGLYGKYSHPLSAEGLHILSRTDFNTPHNEDVGVVRSSYIGDLVQAPALQNGLNVWHKVGISLGNIYTTALSGKYEKVRVAKHNAIEYLFRGYALKVWIAPIRDYAATIAIQWLVDDLERAANFKSERLTASRLRKNVIKPAGAKAWKATEANKKAGINTVLPDEVWIESLSGVAMDLRKLSEPTMLQLYLGGVPVQKMEFVPNDATRVLTFVDMLVDEPNFVAEIVA
jgi:hypothetical protein